MSEKPKRSETPSARGPGFFRQLIDQFRLSWALLQDNRVPIGLKLIPIGAVAYVLSPIDLVPDFVPILGQLDDLGILMTALTVFNCLSPADLVSEHLERLHMGSAEGIERNDKGQVIDVKIKPD
jgi:uncharacterized membrane protein YkvA (DUF1232 family)